LKKIEAIIRTSALDAVKAALKAEGIAGMTVSEVRGCGRTGGHTKAYRGAEYVADLAPKIKLEVVVPDGRSPSVVDCIERSARTGRTGDGKIFVLPVEQVVRIRTGERGRDAL